MIIVKNERSPVRIPGTWGRVYRIDPYFNVTEIRPRDSEADQLLRSIVHADAWRRDGSMIGERYKVLKERRRSRIGVD